MAKKTMFGKLLNQVRFEREMARNKTESLLWKRNKLDNPAKRDKYRMEHIRILGKDTEEVTKIQLWHLVDEAVVVMSTDVSSEIVSDEEPDKGIAGLFE